MTVAGEASKAVMGIYLDGKYIGGRNASSSRAQTDESGNILNYTYYWKGAIIKIRNQPTGNHKVTIKLSVSGAGFKETKTSWSGTVFIEENAETTVVLEGGFGESLHRVQ